MALTRFGHADKQDVGTVHPQLPAPEVVPGLVEVEVAVPRLMPALR
jgi:hypothetical protein